MTRHYYRAVCRKCGAWVGSDDESKWLADVFLPERCPQCHELNPTYSESLYERTFGYWKFVPYDVQRPKVWFLPWTWGPSGKHVWVDWDKEQQLLRLSSLEPSHD